MHYNITLRPWHLDDLSSLKKYADNEKIAQFMTNKFPYPFTEEKGIAFINFATKDNPIHIFAIDFEGEAIGGIGIHPLEDIFKKNAELGYWLAEPYWGKGIMGIAILKILDFAFQTYDINRVFARPFGNNHSSQKLLEKSNFKLEGRFEQVIYKNGAYQDEWVYAIKRENWDQN